MKQIWKPKREQRKEIDGWGETGGKLNIIIVKQTILSFWELNRKKGIKEREQKEKREEDRGTVNEERKTIGAR